MFLCTLEKGIFGLISRGSDNSPDKTHQEKTFFEQILGFLKQIFRTNIGNIKRQKKCLLSMQT
jgi:hypothetical protein